MIWLGLRGVRTNQGVSNRESLRLKYVSTCPSRGFSRDSNRACSILAKAEQEVRRHKKWPRAEPVWTWSRSVSTAVSGKGLP